MPDGFGGTITLTRRPARIVSLAPNVTEILFAVGAGDRVVGVTRFCNWPPEVARLPKVGGYTDLNVEAVLGLSPDLVIASRGNPKTLLATLSSHGLKLLAAVGPESFEEIEHAIERVGRATDNERQARQVCENIRSAIASVRDAVKGVEPRRRVYFGSLTAPYWVAGQASFIGQCIEMAGGENIARRADDSWLILSVETIIERDPEVIIEGFHADSGKGDHQSKLLARLHADPVWSRVAAVREGRVYVLNDDIIHRPGPRVAQAVAEMARLFYPERFPSHGGKKPQ
jgi:iron complex transport system substrate-binding protein